MKIVALEEGLFFCDRREVPVRPAVRARGRSVRMMVRPSVSRSHMSPSDPVSEAMARLKRSAGIYYTLATCCGQD